MEGGGGCFTPNATEASAKSDDNVVAVGSETPGNFPGGSEAIEAVTAGEKGRRSCSKSSGSLTMAINECELDCWCCCCCCRM